MSAWPGKYVIGLTGNIATGKSLVRRMLESLGAFGIDADALAHKVIKPGSQGYYHVVKEFGQSVLAPGGEVNRAKLGEIVFADPLALQRLEAVIHPLVGEQINTIISTVDSSTIVIEAIKLIEAGLDKQCDTLWVTWSITELQIARLMQSRRMDLEEAYRRISAQPPQAQKISKADQVIENNGSIQELRERVLQAWNNTFPDKQFSDDIMELMF